MHNKDMKNSLFITGASGFIGSNLLKKMDMDSYENVYCLGRKENALIKKLSKRENFHFIKADISESERYEPFLKSSSIVIHLAALTGKANREDYFYTNSKGTEILLEQCRRRDIQRFIFMSTIAVEFKNIEGYHYAYSKIKAEKNVEASGIPYTILRLTIVIGKDSPILKSLLQLAKLPVVPIFGDGLNKIQPIYIDDLIRRILRIIEKGSFENETKTIAGPEKITMEEFIRVLHGLSYTKAFKRFHLPVGALRKPLLFLEKFILPLLPFTAGQLASFTNDGISEISPCFEDDGSEIRGIDEMLRLAISPENREEKNVMELEKECETFTKYLINTGTDKYVRQKYIKGHKTVRLERGANHFDFLLIKVAKSSSFFLKLADSYSSYFYKKSLLRKKLLLLLAILECSGSFFKKMDKSEECTRPVLIVNMVQKFVISLFMLSLSVLVFSPLNVYASLIKDPSKRVEL